MGMPEYRPQDIPVERARQDVSPIQLNNFLLGDQYQRRLTDHLNDKLHS